MDFNSFPPHPLIPIPLQRAQRRCNWEQRGKVSGAKQSGRCFTEKKLIGEYFSFVFPPNAWETNSPTTNIQETTIERMQT